MLASMPTNPALGVIATCLIAATVCIAKGRINNDYHQGYNQLFVYVCLCSPVECDLDHNYHHHHLYNFYHHPHDGDHKDDIHDNDAQMDDVHDNDVQIMNENKKR